MSDLTENYAEANSAQLECIELRNRVAELQGLLTVARCPNTQCSDGTIPHGPTPDGGWEAEQCQWCDERGRAIKGDNDD